MFVVDVTAEVTIRGWLVMNDEYLPTVFLLDGLDLRGNARRWSGQ
jgi:hypothetical protein